MTFRQEISIFHLFDVVDEGKGRGLQGGQVGFGLGQIDFDAADADPLRVVRGLFVGRRRGIRSKGHGDGVFSSPKAIANSVPVFFVRIISLTVRFEMSRSKDLPDDLGRAGFVCLPGFEESVQAGGIGWGGSGAFFDFDETAGLLSP
jgi:hypothetical protein